MCDVFPIVRLRWHCVTCKDFDLCEACAKKHSPDHPLQQITVAAPAVAAPTVAAPAVGAPAGALPAGAAPAGTAHTAATTTTELCARMESVSPSGEVTRGTLLTPQQDARLAEYKFDTVLVL